MIKALFLISTVFILSDCASSQSDATLSQVDPNGLPLICTREYPTGSHLPVKICRSQDQIEQDRATAEIVIRRTTD